MRCIVLGIVFALLFPASAIAQENRGQCRTDKVMESLERISYNKRIENIVRKLFKVKTIGSVATPPTCQENFSFEILKILPANRRQCERLIIQRNDGYVCKQTHLNSKTHLAILETSKRNNGVTVAADKLVPDDPRFWPNVQNGQSRKSPPYAALPAGEDQDNDGIINAQDLCLFQAETKNGLFDADGCPDEDRDRDGVINALDVCPTKRETKNGFQENDGCPDYIGKELDTLSKRFRFLSGTPKLNPVSRSAISEVSTLLRKHTGSFKVIIEGFAYSRNQPQHRQKIAQQRADYVREALIDSEVEESRLKAVGRNRIPPEALDNPVTNSRIRLLVTEMRTSDENTLDLSSFSGVYQTEHLRLTVTPAPEDCHINVLENAPDWLRSQSSGSEAYSAALSGHRLVLHFRGMSGEFAIIFMKSESQFRGMIFSGTGTNSEQWLSFSGHE